MLNYNYVMDDLKRVEDSIKTALRVKDNSEADKAALKEALALVQQAGEKCRLAQREFLEETVTHGMEMR